jgi:hypothetical protein
VATSESEVATSWNSEISSRRGGIVGTFKKSSQSYKKKYSWEHNFLVYSYLLYCFQTNIVYRTSNFNWNLT